MRVAHEPNMCHVYINTQAESPQFDPFFDLCIFICTSHLYFLTLGTIYYGGYVFFLQFFYLKNFFKKIKVKINWSLYNVKRNKRFLSTLIYILGNINLYLKVQIL